MSCDAPLRKRQKRAASAPGEGADTGRALRTLRAQLPDDPLQAYSLPRVLDVIVPMPFRLRTATGPTLRSADLAWALAAMERTVRPMYDRSAMRWSSAQKRREFRSEDQRLLFVEQDHVPLQQNSGQSNSASTLQTPLAFISYRAESYEIETPPRNAACQASSCSGGGSDLTQDSIRNGSLCTPSPVSPAEHTNVVYLYELFVDERARGHGVAISLMSILEVICLRAGFTRVVLTVLDENTPAVQLYKNRLGYTVDTSSPCEWGVHDAKYQILVKHVSPKGKSES